MTDYTTLNEYINNVNHRGNIKSRNNSINSNKTPAAKNTKTLKESRYISHHEIPNRTKMMAALGSTIGTVGSLLLLAKSQNKNLFKIKDVLDISYGVKEISAMGIASVAGGVAFGSLADKKDDNVPKVKEGIFQIMNVVVPAVCTNASLKAVEATKFKNSKAAKIGAIGLGVTMGMMGASAVANFINDPNNNEKDRKITPKDALVNLDDAIGALVLAKFPLVEKLHLHRIIPAIFAWCGFRAGQSN